MKLVDGLLVGTRLGGVEVGFGALLEDGTPVCVMKGSVIVDSYGYQVEFVSFLQAQVHPWESVFNRVKVPPTGVSVYRRKAKVEPAKLSCQQQEMIGLDPLIIVPVRSEPFEGKNWFRVEVSGDLPDKPLQMIWRGLWGF